MSDISRNHTSTESNQALESEIEQLAPLIDEIVDLPWSGRQVVVRRPTDLDRLLDQVVEDPEQNLPYWSEIWPSGIALADAIFTSPEIVAGQCVLELGCGLGVTASAALAVGADVIATDYAPEALLLCRLNAIRNSGREPTTVQTNWRQLNREAICVTGGYPVILAADVLYEARDIAPLLACVDALLAPGGLLWLAEPERAVASRFLEMAMTASWSGPMTIHTGPWPDPKDRGVRVRLHQLRRVGEVTSDLSLPEDQLR